MPSFWLFGLIVQPPSANWIALEQQPPPQSAQPRTGLIRDSELNTGVLCGSLRSPKLSSARGRDSRLQYGLDDFRTQCQALTSCVQF